MIDPSFYKQTTLPELAKGITHPPLPSKIGPYKVESLLSKGGMSLLYLALHPETRQPLAIKVLSPDYVTHPEATARFLKEAHIIGMTNHPNIVKLYGEGEWEGGLYIAMEMIHGISLKQFILQHSLSLKRTIDIILQVSYALLHLHTHGVIHRDLKPENILITEDGEIKVIDFGIAQLHEETPPGQAHAPQPLMGTLNYMSPEQKENSAAISFASDIYSLGVIVYELVTGNLSYGMINLSLLPKGLKKIVEKALAVSTKERYADIVDFIADVSQYLKSGEIEKDRPGSDQIKELYETLQKAGQSLSPAALPDWPLLEMGMARTRGTGQVSLYYDFIKFPNNSYLILLSATKQSGVAAPIFMADLRGKVRALLYDAAPTFKEPFHPSTFLSSLQQVLLNDWLAQQFAFSVLLLDPLKEQLIFSSCGLMPLFHVAADSRTPRLLGSPNPALGAEAAATFAETTDNWRIGDHLYLTSFEPSLNDFTAEIAEAIAEYGTLSATRQADSILKRLNHSPQFPSERMPALFFSLLRVS